jgi:hypothetical protein
MLLANLNLNCKDVEVEEDPRQDGKMNTIAGGVSEKA